MKEEWADGRLREGSAAPESGTLELLAQDRFLTGAMAVIPPERPGTTKSALPGKIAEDRQQPKLRPPPAVQTAKVARAAMLADSFTQRIEPPHAIGTRQGVPIFVAQC